jgi:AraC-like DNA-binding protein
MIKHKAFIINGIIILLISLSPLLANTEITSPISGEIYRSNSCTLSVETTSPLDSLLFTIEYRSKRGVTRSKRVGLLTTPPYRVVWHAENIPNQYYFGAKVTAELFLENKSSKIIEKSRIYIFPEEIKNSTFANYKGTYEGESYDLVGDSSSSGSIHFNYNDSTFNVSINHSSNTAVDKDSAIIIILDPKLEKLPFPGNSTIILRVPFKGKSSLITSFIDTTSGELSVSRTDSDISVGVSTFFKSDSSYSSTISIPKYLFGVDLPNSFGLNIIVPTDKSYLSLFTGQRSTLYTPILFPIIQKRIAPTEQHESNFISFIIPFGITTFISIIAIIIFLLKGKKESKQTLEFHKDRKKKLYLLDSLITDSLLTMEVAAKKMGVTVHDLKKICHDEVGKTFIAYVKWSRVEIVKERLISSNASEIAIAQDCGFESITDMENSFHHLTGVAPYQFREKNRIN